MPSYALILKLDEPLTVKVGSLGTVLFEPGLYAYVGSGGQNLKARVIRHMKLKAGTGSVKWHIDYLLVSRGVKLIGAVLFPLKSEHEAVAVVSKVSRQVVKGFGSSDCRCFSHLFKLRTPSALKTLLSEPDASFLPSDYLSAF